MLRVDRGLAGLTMAGGGLTSFGSGLLETVEIYAYPQAAHNYGQASLHLLEPRWLSQDPTLPFHEAYVTDIWRVGAAALVASAVYFLIDGAIAERREKKAKRAPRRR